MNLGDASLDRIMAKEDGTMTADSLDHGVCMRLKS